MIQRAVALCLALCACGRAAPAIDPTTAAPEVSAPTSPIGDVSALDARLRRAFDPADHFAPIPTPEPGMWLAEHPEAGQTYDQYVLNAPNVPTSDRRTIYIQPLGPIAADLPLSIDEVARFIGIFFGLPVKVLPVATIAETKATVRDNDDIPQALTSDLLKWMYGRLPDDAFAVIGVTLHDLYPQESWNFVFGQATFKDRVGVFSFARFDDAFDGRAREAGWQVRFVERSIHLLAHEIGHMFSMRHCVHYACLMNGTNSLAESDTQPAYACPVCLHKLYYALRFDVVARERALLGFYEAHALTTLAAWSKRRLAHLDAP